ncbi:MAG: hypothetical protein JSV35_03880 [Candidatus Bathyarchaeota archaeon]|nr:MAG: hypothetical protein JSV35_03880 [Candidatus Bathyarchaeota archaeon]
MKRSTLTLLTFAIAIAALSSSVTAKPAKTTLPIAEASFDFLYICLNLKSQSSLAPAYVELPEGYDVSDINPSSILLNGSIPIHPSIYPTIGDYDNDTIPDLHVVFNRTEIVEYIQSEGITHGTVNLRIQGSFARTPATFEGNDNLTVSSLVGDVNCDEIVNLLDIVIASDSFDTADGDENWNHNANFAPHWNRNDIFDFVTLIAYYGETLA